MVDFRMGEERETQRPGAGEDNGAIQPQKACCCGHVACVCAAQRASETRRRLAFFKGCGVD